MELHGSSWSCLDSCWCRRVGKGACLPSYSYIDASSVSVASVLLICILCPETMWFRRLLRWYFRFVRPVELKYIAATSRINLYRNLFYIVSPVKYNAGRLHLNFRSHVLQLFEQIQEKEIILNAFFGYQNPIQTC